MSELARLDPDEPIGAELVPDIEEDPWDLSRDPRVRKAELLLSQQVPVREVARRVGRSKSWVHDVLVTARRRWARQADRDLFERYDEILHNYYEIYRDLFREFKKSKDKGHAYRPTVDVLDRIVALTGVDKIAKDNLKRRPPELPSKSEGIGTDAADSRDVFSTLLDATRRAIQARR